MRTYNEETLQRYLAGQTETPDHTEDDYTGTETEED